MVLPRQRGKHVVGRNASLTLRCFEFVLSSHHARPYLIFHTYRVKMFYSHAFRVSVAIISGEKLFMLD